MTEFSTHEPTTNSLDTNDDSEIDAIAELRKLLISPEQEKLEQIQKRLDDPQIHAEDISRVLPEAIILRSLQNDEQLTQALLPTVEEAIQASVKKDLHVLANAIFPIIGPAIRKSIATTLSTMLQSLNQTLEHSFSIQSFKWRLEARQTGKSFAEVVLLRTLLYRVEQVFLIHKKTGLLLQHVTADLVATQDADLVSAMLTAIQDFIQDSFPVKAGENLETLQFGELTIWIEQGPQAVLAGVIRGNAPEELRLVFQQVIETIHREFQRELKIYEGDDSLFESSRKYLESCLQSQYSVKEEKHSPVLWILLGSLLFATGLWSFLSWQSRHRWQTYLTRLEAQPGIVVITTGRRHGKYFVSGLRDPLAINPLTLLQESNIQPQTVVSQWEPYLSFESNFILQRAKQVLQPPETGTLAINENGVLSATGSAPQQWITEAQKLVRTIPGITQLQTKNLTETDFQELTHSQQQIENQILLFGENNTELLPSQDNKLSILFKELQNLSKLAPYYHKQIYLQIIGRTDEQGNNEKNLVLSQARAYKVLSILNSQNYSSINMSAVGIGTKQPLFNQYMQKEQALNRSVSFKVFITDDTTSNKSL
ncbi:OmpA family protein [Chroococcidiopsis sp. TS-821]|uniref:OmpA family protein n=1 Tax=Chroococcidiopsis sp. TS-821 TaxID=1378066 RepID=UPI000CEE41EE|nr:OmpA family protein [Chroococcidiopsis sp. TS-821]PPS39170.1 flagellar motor protein MotB [Chroococcidiopsis sp. TS-821]